MRLKAPYSGGYVEATGELAKHLIARGYTEEPKEEPKKPARKRPTKTRGE